MAAEGWRRRLGALPLAAPVAAAACGVAAVDQGSGWWLAVAVAAGWGVWVDRWRGLLLTLLAAALAAGGHGRRIEADRARLAELFAREERLSCRLDGVVDTVPVIRGGGWTALVRVQGCAEAPAARGLRVWWNGRGEVPVAGARVSAAGVLEKPPPARNPGEFDFAGWLWRQRVGAVFEPAPGSVGRVQMPDGWRGRAERFRSGFAAAITAGLDPDSRAARVIRAMVVGETPAGDEELIAAFRESGALHVFSVSGLHVGMVALIGWAVLRRLRMPRRAASVILLTVVFGYAWLAGWKAPALRSAWMAAVVLAAFVLRRPSGLLQALSAVAVAAIVIDGHQLFLPGFQLSYGVVAAIGVAGEPLGRWFRRFAGHDPFLPRTLLGPWQERSLRWREGTLASFGVSLAAWLGSAPLIGWHFGLLTPVAPLASLMLMPVVFVILLLGLTGAALTPVAPRAGELVNRLNARAAEVSVRLAGAAAAVPGACMPVAALRPRPAELVIHDLPYGGGAASFQASGGGVLFDTGDAASFERVVLPALRARGAKVEDLLLSHPDSGHIGGALVALDALRPRRVWLPVERARSPAYRSLATAAPEDGRLASRMKTGAWIDCGPAARWEVLRVADPVAWDSLADDRCAVLRLHWHGWRVLFTGDSGFLVEQELLDRGADLAADVWVAGRNRRDPGGTAAFVSAVSPRAVVASHARFPPEERVPQDWQAGLESRGIAVFHQGECGAVTLRADPDRLAIEGYIDGRRLVFDRE